MPLASIQGGVVGALNSLRAGALVELDPAGQSVESKWWQEYNSGVKGNVMTTGWGEGTTGFNPHATLNWLPTHVMSQHARSLQALCSEMFHAYITGKQNADAGAGALKTAPPSFNSPAAKTMQYSGRWGGYGCCT